MSKNYTVIHGHSQMSVLDSSASEQRIVKRAKELGMSAVSITDHGSIISAYELQKACKKEGIKNINGIELYVSEQNSDIKDDSNRSHMHLILLCKNKQGWQDLIQLNNEANKHFYYRPRLDFERIKKYAQRGNLIGSSACIAGVIASKLFTDTKEALNTKSVSECRKYLHKDWLKIGCEETKKWHEAFAGQFWLEIQNEGMAAQLVVRDCLRQISKETSIPIIATCDSHFAYKEDAVEHEILICSQLRTTLRERQEKRDLGEDIMFADNSPYYIKSYDEMIQQGFTEEELEETNRIADMVEEYDITTTKPFLPVFPIPKEYKSNEEMFLDICNKKLKELGKDKDNEYLDRFNYEFEIFKSVKTEKTNLLDYFLIIYDIVRKIREMGSFTPVGRGSAAGCLSSYLLGITKVDPIEYDLSFQRFYNTGRMSEDRISLPDIDIDCSSEIRGDLINYLKEKYGEENVTQISTYGRLAPRAAIKEVFRAHEIPFAEANELTKFFPDEEIKHDEEAKCTIEDAMRLSDEFRSKAEKYKTQIESAKKLEGTIKSRGVHAAGIIIADRPIAEFLPLVYDTKTKSLICALEMGAAEAFGAVKADLLALKLLAVFDLCIAKINEMYPNGEKEGSREKPKPDNKEEKLHFYKMVKEYFAAYNLVLERGDAFSFEVEKDGEIWHIMTLTDINELGNYKNLNSKDKKMFTFIIDKDNVSVYNHGREKIFDFGKIIDGKLEKIQ